MDRADGVGSLTGSEPDHPAWTRLVDQLAWYDRKSVAAQRAFKRLKVIEVVIAAAIPVVAGLRWPPWVTAVLGAAVVVLEAVQQLYPVADELGAVPLDGRGAQAREVPVPLRRRPLH